MKEMERYQGVGINLVLPNQFWKKEHIQVFHRIVKELYKLDYIKE